MEGEEVSWKVGSDDGRAGKSEGEEREGPSATGSARSSATTVKNTRVKRNNYQRQTRREYHDLRRGRKARVLQCGVTFDHIRILWDPKAK